MNDIENKFSILERKNTLLQKFSKPSILSYDYDNPLLNIQKKLSSNTLINSLINGNGKKKSEFKNDLEMKKPKLLNSVTSYTNLSLKSNFSSLNSLTCSHILTGHLLPKLNLLTNPQVSAVHLDKLKNNLLQTNNTFGSFSSNTTVEFIKCDNRLHDDFESQSTFFERIYDSEFTQKTSQVYDEFFKVDSLIDVINKQDREHLNKLIKKQKISKKNVLFSDNLFSAMLPKIQTKAMQCQKNALVNLVSASLLRQPNFKSQKDPTRNTLIKLSEAIIHVDPEFILKLALYTRRELNIRVTANFLICLASFKEECRPYLQRYFKAVIMVSNKIFQVNKFFIF